MVKTDRHDNGSGVTGGSKTGMKTIGSGSAFSRLASQKPVDRPVSKKRGWGEGGAGASAGWGKVWQLLGHLPPVCPGTASAPLSMSKGLERHTA